MSQIIRLAERDDLHQLSLYERQLYGAEGYPELLFYQAYRQWPQLLLVSQTDDVASGYSMMAPLDEQRVMLMSLLVATDFQQLGLGKALLEHSMVVARQLGFKRLELSVAPDNTRAVSLYQKAGFAVENEVADYLGKGEHRLIMTTSL